MPNKVLTVIMPSNPVEVIRLLVPGQQGPGGVSGPAGPSSVLSMGTVTTGAPGSTASASLSGVSPNQTLNLTIPRGNQGDAGPASNLTIGTITTSLPGSNGAASITGTSPNYVLNLTLPRGYGVPTGGTGNQVLAKLSGTDYDTGWVSFTPNNTASTIVSRDGSGDSAVRYLSLSGTTPSADHAIRKDYVDGLGTTSATNNTIVRRDNAFARADFGYVGLTGQPTVADHATRKDYVDTQIATRAATSHTHTASQISDSTATGRSVVTATDGAAARSAIGAGTSSLTLGTSNTTAKAGDYQPIAANISDSTATGRSVLTATDAPTARTAIGLGNVDNTSDINKPVSTAQAAADTAAVVTARQLPVNRTISVASALIISDAGSILNVSHAGTSPITITVPTDVTVNFAIGTCVDVRVTSSGMAAIAAQSGASIIGLSQQTNYLPTGSSALLTKVGSNSWMVVPFNVVESVLITMNSGWTNISGIPVKVTRSGISVTLTGGWTNNNTYGAAGSQFTNIMTIPAQFRPATVPTGTLNFNGSANVFGEIGVRVTGEVDLITPGQIGAGTRHLLNMGWAAS